VILGKVKEEGPLRDRKVLLEYLLSLCKCMYVRIAIICCFSLFRDYFRTCVRYLGYTSMNKIDKNPCLCAAYILMVDEEGRYI
jgi:hypothetical protein